MWKINTVGEKKKSKPTVYATDAIEAAKLACAYSGAHMHGVHKCRPRALIDVSQRACEWEPITFRMSNVAQKLASVLLRGKLIARKC